VGVRVLPLRTMAMGIRFGNGNANRVTVINFLSRLWNLVDNQSGLKWQIVASRQQLNVQVGGAEFGLGVFITQAFDRRNLGLGRSRLALLFYVHTQRYEQDCWRKNTRVNSIAQIRD
jgi:hypothetical protein